MNDFERDEFANPICPGCSDNLVIFSAEPGDVQGMCPECDNRPEPKKCACESPKPVLRNTGEGQQHFVCDNCKGIADDWVLDIWKHMTDAGDKTVPFKPQYVRGGWIYTCPLCGHTISSHSYLNVGYFQIACDDHIKECIEILKILSE
ncbi:MAG: hypothetical protein PHC68_18920 [Syntrophorhabdaceae bacterium]|nr:hypothetical protein [Syntrophorhabdaceae bacterium]